MLERRTGSEIASRTPSEFAGNLVPWCSGLAYVPVKDEIAGSNPVGTAVIGGGVAGTRTILDGGVTPGG